MSRFSFNRKRVELKKLLGIRARLALLALILVAPLMLERVRSLEDNRAKQVAMASAEFASLAQHSADGQREVISSVESGAEIDGLYLCVRAAVGRSCDIMRASLPVNLPWISRRVDGRQRWTNHLFDFHRAGRSRSQRSRLSQEGARDPRIRLQRLPVCAANERAGGDGGLSGRPPSTAARMPSFSPASISTGCRRS